MQTLKQKIMYNNLEKVLIENRAKDLKKAKKEIRKKVTSLDADLCYYYKKIVGKKKFKSVVELREFLFKKEVLRINKYFNSKLEELKSTFYSDVYQMPNPLIITIVWKKSKTWGNNPTATAFIPGVGNVSSGSIGGCGYDKESTALAAVLNKIPQIKKALYKKKNQKNKFRKSNREALGYGSGYGVLPSFEGGVGTNCHRSILEGLGFKVSHAGTKTTDTYVISK